MPQEGVVCSVENRFLRALSEIWPEGVPRRAVLAVSGGADSTALALLAGGARPAFFEELAVAHFHHHLRGEEADGDAAFVERLSAGLGLPCARGDWSPEGRFANPRADRNLQASARRARYRFLEEEAESIGAQVILTAHHARDQVETVLRNLARGGGEGAWKGIARDLPKGDFRILRPLLVFSPGEIREYLADKGQSFREDSSNRNLDYSRNWLRASLLPELYRAAPWYEGETVRRASAFDRAEREWIEKGEAIIKSGLWREDRLLLSRKSLLAIPKEGRFLCLRQILRRLPGLEPSTGWAPTRRRPLEEFFQLLENGKDGAVVLPDGVRAVFSGATLSLEIRKREVL